MPVLDANFLIRVGRKDPVALVALERLAHEHLVVPVQAALDFLVGIADFEGELLGLKRSYDLAHTNDDVLQTAAVVRRRALRHSSKPRTADLWIAAHAAHLGTYVVTTNKRHFRDFGVSAWNYEKEPAPPFAA